MTVAELIEKLRELDPETRVMYPAGECFNCVSNDDVTEVKTSFEEKFVYDKHTWRVTSVVAEPVVVIGSNL